MVHVLEQEVKKDGMGRRNFLYQPWLERRGCKADQLPVQDLRPRLLREQVTESLQQASEALRGLLTTGTPQSGRPAGNAGTRKRCFYEARVLVVRYQGLMYAR